jgi:hypothetical protein
MSAGRGKSDLVSSYRGLSAVEMVQPLPCCIEVNSLFVISFGLRIVKFLPM